MTQAETICKWARDQIGVTENPPGSNNVIYNTLYYGRAVSGDAYAWCMAFVWCAFDLNGLSELFYGGRKTASCTTLLKWSKSVGRFYQSGFHPGDVIFYDFDGDPSSEHTGIIVEAYSDEDLRVVEGNCGNAVKLVTPKVSTIMGVFRPDYKDEPAPIPQPSGPTCTPTLPILQRGSKGIPVWSLQKLLIKRGYSVGPDGADGDFGANTQSGVRKFQEAHGLKTDGVVGTATWTALYEV